MSRFRAKVDANQRTGEFKRAAEAVGASWQSIAGVGDGCPDGLVGFRDRNYIGEIKNPDQPPSKRKLTDDEVTWHENWEGQVAVWETPQDMLKTLGIRS